MQVLDPGHRYAIDPNGDEIQFIKKQWRPVAGELMRHAQAVIDPPDARFLVTTGGTTNEEVLAVLIDRTEFLDAQFQCPENKIALACMRQALDAFNARTTARQQQGVEGTLAAHVEEHKFVVKGEENGIDTDRPMETTMTVSMRAADLVCAGFFEAMYSLVEDVGLSLRQHDYEEKREFTTEGGETVDIVITRKEAQTA